MPAEGRLRGDDEVIERAKQGDAEAWRTLYRAHAGRLVVWLSARPSPDAASSPDDLAAEAWLTAAAKIAGFHGTVDEFAGWLFGIARKLSANSYRRSARRNTYPAGTCPDTGHDSGPEPQLAARDWVDRVLASLPARERDVVACLDVVGLDVAATARALGVSQVAVRVAHHRAIKRLRSQVAPLPSPVALG